MWSWPIRPRDVAPQAHLAQAAILKGRAAQNCHLYLAFDVHAEEQEDLRGRPALGGGTARPGRRPCVLEGAEKAPFGAGRGGLLNTLNTNVPFDAELSI